jgi:membrane fusion protein, multidrug efflux system
VTDAGANRSASPAPGLAVVLPPSSTTARQLWVVANVEETSVSRVRPGQRVSVHVDTLNADLEGTVAAIVQASAQSFSPLPQQNLSGNYTKVTQLQPVKIVFDRPDPRLALGTSVEVKIRVAD